MTRNILFYHKDFKQKKSQCETATSCFILVNNKDEFQPFKNREKHG